MQNNIFSILEKLGFGHQTRAINAKFSSPLLTSQVFIQRIDGHHEINKGLMCELICLSVNPNIELKEFIGCGVAVDQVTDQGTIFRTTGIIVEASQGKNDGSLATYKLKIEDATSLWKKRRNSRVFMNKSVVEITQIIFKNWQEQSALFASSLSLDLTGLTKDYDIRPFTMQVSSETEYEFLTRLWRSESINWLIDEKELFVPHNQADIQPQKLRLLDDNHEFTPLDRRVVRFHRSDATERFDTITNLIAERSLQASAVHVQRWQPQHLEQEDGAGSVLSFHQQSNHYDNETLCLEDAWHVQPAWVGDLNHEDDVTQADNKQVEKLNQNLAQQHRLKSKYFTAHSTVRDVQVGHWFKLTNHPEIDTHSGSDQEFLILAKHFYNQNNLPKDIQKQAEELLTASRWQLQDEDQRQGNTLTLVRRAIPVVPDYNPEHHKPVAAAQRAKVVGIDGESIHVDEWGRIKVRFLFTREEDNVHDGGAGSNNTDTDSAWVDVLTPWAGEGYGARFLPRVGTLVVVDFFNNDVDRPFVAGRLHEGQQTPTQFDQKGKLPDTKKLSGIRSQEVDGKGFNQIRFDDTSEQISAQLQSSHEASQLNLGNLSHPKETETSEGRGEGFELRTDAFGAVRAGKGLMLSTYERNQAEKNQLTADETKKQLNGTLKASQGLADLAKKHHAEPIEVLNALQQFIENLEKEDSEKAETFKEALILLATPKTVAISAEKNIQLTADQHILQTAQDSISLSAQTNLVGHAQEKISLFSANKEAKIYTGQGKIELQAQNNGIDIFGCKDIEVAATEGSIHLTATKEIILTVQNTQLKLTPSGFSLITNGKGEYKAAQHNFSGPARAKSLLPALPIVDLKPTDLVLEHLHSDGQPVQGAPFEVLFMDGTRKKGKLDKNGRAVLRDVPQGKAVVQYGEDQSEQKRKPSPNEDWFSALDQNSSSKDH